MNSKSIILTIIILTMLTGTIMAQIVNQITIYPANPKINDTIYIVSDLSYNGNCAFGLVYSNTTIEDSIIYITPTYCGYWDTTPCRSIDTFKIAPLPIRKYIVKIEYHEGSVCPISDFDATLAQFDTFLTVSGSTNIADLQTLKCNVNVYPNPANNHIKIDIEDFSPLDDYQIQITNTIGQRVFQSSINQKQFYVDLSNCLESGIYFVCVTDGKGKTIDKRIIVLQIN